ncbi:hypothetical protein NMR69_003586 [Vibrio cholerae]|uniref:abortive infection system antitoxin AbiGi family protein n=1 Tax=Vibrio TaxID=662 RepID=UPI0018DC73E2|nr:abortive infection system antitoxin AbiGi family protein [Vibrio navarrensis]EIR1601446.1 hypothetical protein [Vibrio cholerae]EJL6575621.1 hypothetical protein [Vibrio cholerae]MBH9742235.1 hypothetical protein [Vibrio navarrensis]GHX71999.1 hypothetical protein VCSRO11_3553 [Vibrio cholerae]HDZ9263777.1 hypothetical protein [Vibrio cholerae]
MRPGTVSKVLWHFTGGPKWDSTTSKQLDELKPVMSSYDALKSILTSTELRVGNYQEIVKVMLPEKRKYNFETHQDEIQKDVPITVKSMPVCCVADIPLQHLAYHAKRYGKIAIGFRREAILKAGFNPVMYTLHNSLLLNSIYAGYDAINDVDPTGIETEVESVSEEVDRKLEEHGIDDYIDFSGPEFEIKYAKKAQAKVENSYSQFLAYIKTFDSSEFDSIYCEREWRSTSNFSFSLDDIALIVLPAEQEGFDFYSDFLKTFTLPRNITVARWEDLVEH